MLGKSLKTGRVNRHIPPAFCRLSAARSSRCFWASAMRWLLHAAGRQVNMLLTSALAGAARYALERIGGVLRLCR